MDISKINMMQKKNTYSSIYCSFCIYFLSIFLVFILKGWLYSFIQKHKKNPTWCMSSNEWPKWSREPSNRGPMM